MATTSSPLDLSPLSMMLTQPLSVHLIVHLIRQLLLSQKVWNYLKGFAIGASLSNSLWLRDLIWQRIKGLFFAKAVFRDGDLPYDWVKRYIAKRQSSFKGRDVEVSEKGDSRSDSDDEDDYSDDEDEAEQDHEHEHEPEHIGTTGRRGSVIVSEAHGPLPSDVALFPLDSARFHFVFDGVHVFAVRERQLVGDGNWEETLTLSFLTWKRSVIGKFITEAKAAYDMKRVGKVTMYGPHPHGHYWTATKSVSKRSSESVHLPNEIKKKLLDDAGFFLKDETRAWYHDRGIPYRRGYLLYGPPGTGKTSLAHVLASEYDLPIYQVALSGRELDDNYFQALMRLVPARAIVILEDVDAAFRDRKVAAAGPQASSEGAKSDAQSSVSFSCLLNAIDGLGAADSRVLLMTTNHRELLDEALIRPGRTDLQFEFKKADRSQMKQLFKRWFLPASKKLTSSAASDAGSDFSSASSDDYQSQSSSSEAGELGEAVAGPFNRLVPSHAELEANAEAFANVVPEYTRSIAEVQGYLLTCSGKTLRETVEGAKVWLEQKL